MTCGSLVIIAVVLITGCHDQTTTQQRGEIVEMGSFTKYSQMNSGYHDPDGSRMQQFLECWREQTVRYAKLKDIKWTNKYTKQDLSEAQFILPPSLRNFWRYAPEIGWMSVYDLEEERRFDDPKNYDYMQNKDTEYYRVMLESVDESDTPNSDYYTYNKDQREYGPYAFNVNHLLLIGKEYDSAFSALIDNEKSIDGEFQAYWYSPHQAGTRVKSFAHLLVHLYLEEYKNLNEGDSSAGYIYFFEGDWNDTCVPLLFDEDEIKSWGVSERGTFGSMFGEIERD